jgi:fucose permease
MRIGFIAQFGQNFDGEMALVAKEVSAWGAVQQCGQIFTQFTSPWVIDRFGRKSTMYLLAGFMAVVCLLVSDCETDCHSPLFLASLLKIGESTSLQSCLPVWHAVVWVPRA